jgi:FkbM family methyltransferase
MIKNLLKGLLEYFYPEFLYAKTFFSQDGEDALLASYYEGIKGYKGFYVDVGAHHPFRFSNTAHFYKRGWKGINIEPTPNLFWAFRRHRKRDINLNIGIAWTRSFMKFYEFDEPALNSFDEKLSLERNNKTNYNIIGERDIEVNSLEDTLNQYLPEGQIIDFMTIDVEGLDIEVLKSNNWNKFRSRFLLVEGEFDAKNLNKSAIFQYLESYNYHLVGRTTRTFLFEDTLKEA